MKLNMWMIANRLSALEPEMHIPEDAPVNLLSARRAYATQCVYVYQKGNDVICDAEDGGYIIFHDMDCDQVFEMIQFTFDFYQEWQDMLSEATDALDYRRIVDQSWQVFHNPMMLLDANSKVLFLSEQYGEDDVNNDWRYLSRNGHSSEKIIHYLLKEGRNYNYYLNRNARIYHFNAKDMNCDMVSAAIYYRNEHCGRINIIEKDRKVNPGDVYLLDHVIRYMSIVLGRLNEMHKDEQATYNILAKLLQKQPVSHTDFVFWRKYTGWTDQDELQVAVLAFERVANVNEVITVCGLLQNGVPGRVITQVEQYIAMLYSASEAEEVENHEYMAKIIQRFHLKCGTSLPAKGFENLHYFYKQALWAVSYGRLSDPDTTIHRFYDYALEAIIAAESLEESVCACQPDIVHMWEEGEEGGGEKIITLWAYLENERSLINTANELFMHRNTLVYRLKKITDVLQYNINEVYTRDYMKLSIRLLRLMKKKKDLLI